MSGLPLNFDWNTAELSRDTLLTDTFEITPNVLRYFKQQTDNRFKINVEFRKWLHANIGKTLGDAVFEYRVIQTRNSHKFYQAKIKRGAASLPVVAEIQSYALAFLRDNPTLTMVDVRRVLTKKTKVGPQADLYVYDRSDLDL